MGSRGHAPKESVMSSVADVPVTVTPEAAEHIAEWGLQGEFEQIIEQLRRTLPGLLRITATFRPVQYETDDIDRVLIEVGMSDRGIPYDPAVRAYEAWESATFPPDVLRLLMVMVYREQANGR